MDELPKELPDVSEVPPKPKPDRFPLNVFADCIGADGINIMGRRFASQNSSRQQQQRNGGNSNNGSGGTNHQRHRHPPLSRERLEAFLAMTTEQQQEAQRNGGGVLGAITWDHGTVLFPIGDDLEEVAGMPTVGDSNNPPPPEAVEAARQQQRRMLEERRMRIANGNFLPPPPPIRSGRSSSFGGGGGGLGGGYHHYGNGGNGDDDTTSQLSSPTFAPTDSEFPATTTVTSHESAHSSDMARADAAAIEAATRGLNPMSAQAAVLRAAAIHRREMRLKRRKEQSIILSNLERHERYGLAELGAGSVGGGGGGLAGAAVATSSNAAQNAATPSGEQTPQKGSMTPQRQFLTFSSNSNNKQQQQQLGSASVSPGSAAVKREGSSPPSGSSPQSAGNNNNNNTNNSGGGGVVSRTQQFPRVPSRSSVTTDGDGCSSMPDLQSASASEVAARSKQQQQQQQRQDSGPSSRASPVAAQNQSTFLLQQQQGQPAAQPPPPPFPSDSQQQHQQQQQYSKAAMASSAPFTSTTSKDRPRSSSKQQQQQQQQQSLSQSQQQQQQQQRDHESVAVGIPNQGLSEAELHRLQKQEHTLIRSKVHIDDFGAAKGRGVRSKCVFNPGELIFRARPDLGVLYSDFRKLHCAHCFRPSLDGRAVASSSGAAQHVCLASCDSLIVCPHCDCFALCVDCGGKPDLVGSAAAAAAASTTTTTAAAAATAAGNGSSGSSSSSSSSVAHLWQRHNSWCKWLRTLPASVRSGDTDYLRFLLEYAARVQGGDVALVESVSSLCSLEEAQSDEVKKFCDSFSGLISNTFTSKGLAVSRAALREALLRIKCNALGFPFTREATIGWATHGTLCMINHSCAPNGALTQSPLGEMEVRAIREIAPGEEITISYLHLPDYPSKQERRRHLLTQYRFLCRCERCEKEK